MNGPVRTTSVRVTSAPTGVSSCQSLAEIQVTPDSPSPCETAPLVQLPVPDMVPFHTKMLVLRAENVMRELEMIMVERDVNEEEEH